VHEQVPGLARIDVDGSPCVAYLDLTGPVEEGDDVLVNVQARELELGSGGFHVLHANLSRGLGLPAAPGAHVMKLPYTPIQFAVRHGEEDGELPASLEGMPVVACSLHSQVAPVCAALAGLPVAYVQFEGGALALALSDTLRALRAAGLLQLTIGAGACFGGDLDAVSVYSALALGRGRDADVIVAGIGPGVVGTASTTGHGGTAAAAALLAAEALGGRGVLALRLSERDPRDRHRGISHHSESVLGLVSGGCELAWPAGCQLAEPPEGAVEVDVAGWEEACSGLPLSHMGRGPDEDPCFFAAAFAAGRRARQLLE
jgi:hypothetical protein